MLEGVPELASFLDRIPGPARCAVGQTTKDAEQCRVLAPGQEREQPRVHGEERGNSPTDADTALIGEVDAREEPQDGRLPRAAGPDQRDAVPAGRREAHVANAPRTQSVTAQTRSDRRHDLTVPVEVITHACTVEADHGSHDLCEVALLR